MTRNSIPSLVFPPCAKGVKANRPVATSENTITLFVCPPKFCISFVSSFSWNLQMVPREHTNNAYAKFWGTTKSIMFFFRNGLLRWNKVVVVIVALVSTASFWLTNSHNQNATTTIHRINHLVLVI